LKKLTLPEKGLDILFGSYDENIKYLETLLNVRIVARGSEVMVEGDAHDVQTVEAILADFAALVEEGVAPLSQELRQAFKQIADDRTTSLKSYFSKTYRFNPTGKKMVQAKTANQRRYLEALEKHDIVFGIGPAGTGKTFLAVAMALQYLWTKKVSRIILTRPAVEAGEKLGFLPGDLQDKVDPYLRPLYDALFDLADPDKIGKMLEKRIIEIAPLAFMRGRAQSLDSRLLTPDGWMTMGEVRVGDLLIGSNGKPIRVTGVFPQGKKLVYRVTLTDGSSTLACAEHLWQVKTMEDKRRNRPPRILQTSEMIGNFRRNHQYRYEIPLLSEPVDWRRREVPIDPYTLGLLIGDGCITGKTSPSFTTSDQELALSLESGLSGMGLRMRRKSNIDYSIVNPLAGRGGHHSLMAKNSLQESLKELGLLGTRSSTKFIPELYLFNEPSVRHALLQGLLDTDGGPVTQKGRTCRVQYTTTSEKLKNDVVFLVRSLGGTVTVRCRAAEGRKPGFANGREVGYRNDAFVLDIRLPNTLKPFRLKRKAAVYEVNGGGRPMRFIKNIEPVGEMETQCISVEAEDSLYVTDEFILTHNTLSDAFIILDEAQNTTSEQMKMFLTRIGHNSRAAITGDATQIDLPGGRISGLIEAQRILGNIEGIDIIRFSDRDVVRHRLVQLIVQAYERATRESVEKG
jgi:phosphate starvation-inducible protein PhoH and related proteins